jgi:hypothetical protein
MRRPMIIEKPLLIEPAPTAIMRVLAMEVECHTKDANRKH